MSNKLRFGPLPRPPSFAPVVSPIEAAILDKMKRLKDAGRFPGLTTTDAVHATGRSLKDTEAALIALRAKGLITSETRNQTIGTIWMPRSRR